MLRPAFSARASRVFIRVVCRRNEVRGHTGFRPGEVEWDVLEPRSHDATLCALNNSLRRLPKMLLTDLLQAHDISHPCGIHQTLLINSSSALLVCAQDARASMERPVTRARGGAKVAITSVKVGLLALPADVVQRFAIPSLAVEGVVEGLEDDKGRPFELNFGRYVPAVSPAVLRLVGVVTADAVPGSTVGRSRKKPA